MAYGQIIRQGLRLAGKVDRKYNINKIFVQKYVPPGYRNRVNKIFDIVGALGGGYGLYNAYQSLNAPDTPGNSAQIPFKKQQFKASKSYQTRRRYTTRTCPRYPIESKPYQKRRRSYSR